MPTFDSVVAGTEQYSAPREVELRNEIRVRVAYRPLSSAEDAEAETFGKSYAKGLGYPGDADLEERGRLAKRVVLSFVDPDNTSAPFFPMGAEAILKDRRIGAERIVYLNELQEHYEDQCVPSRLRLSDGEFHTQLRAIAGADSPDPFVDMRPGLRWIFVRTTARLLVDFLRLSSGSGGTSLSTPSPPSLPQPPPRPAPSTTQPSIRPDETPSPGSGES